MTEKSIKGEGPQSRAEKKKRTHDEGNLQPLIFDLFFFLNFFFTLPFFDDVPNLATLMPASSFFSFFPFFFLFFPSQSSATSQMPQLRPTAATLPSFFEVYRPKFTIKQNTRSKLPKLVFAWPPIAREAYQDFVLSRPPIAREAYRPLAPSLTHVVPGLQIQPQNSQS